MLGLHVLASTAEAWPGTPLHAEVLSTLSSVCARRGRTADLESAEQHARQGLVFLVKAHGVKSLEAAAMYTILASAQQKLARCVRMKLESALQRHKAADTSRLLVGRLVEAEASCIKALDIREAVCVADDLRIAESLCVLCAVHTAKGDLARAEEEAERCIYIRQAQQRCRISGMALALQTTKPQVHVPVQEAAVHAGKLVHRRSAPSPVPCVHGTAQAGHRRTGGRNMY